jgi:hypothetical protein
VGEEAEDQVAGETDTVVPADLSSKLVHRCQFEYAETQTKPEESTLTMTPEKSNKRV